MEDLKWSRFIFWAESKNKNKTIVRNTLTTATVRMTNEVKAKIDLVIERGEMPEEHSETFRYIKKLAETEILVPAALNEEEKYLQLFKKARDEDKTFSIYLVLTTDCQFACSYCFERGIDRTKFMSLETAQKIVDWCSAYLDRNRECAKLRIILYGGEPLLNKETIQFILPRLYNIAQNKGLEFETGILTNGELLDIDMLSFLQKHNLDRLQITLDGYGIDHDLRRMRKDGGGTFEKISENIMLALNGDFIQKINLRINFDRQNVDAIPKLLDFFAENGIQKKIELSLGIIAPTICGDLGQRTSDDYLEKFGLNLDESADKFVWLSREAKLRGFGISQEFLVGPWCTARAIHSATIETGGSLMKCISTVGREGFSFGNVFSYCDTIDERFEDFSYLHECLSKKCPFVPICGGGCRFDAYVTTGDISKPYCRRKLVEKINKGLVQLSFEGC